MGNCQCQAADDAAAAIQHPDGRVETANWPLSAGDVMTANPGHYVAVIITVRQSRSSDIDQRGSGGRPVRYLELLGPGDSLQLGHLHYLVTFEDVLREFGKKRRVRLSKLLKRKKEELRRQRDVEANSSSSSPSSSSTVAEGDNEEGGGSDDISSENGLESYGSIRLTRHGQWRPTLQPIAEVAAFK